MEMQGRNKGPGYFADAGDGAFANFNQELQQIKRSVKRCQKITAVILSLLAIVLLALIIVAGMQARTIRRLKAREGLLPHPNVTFASYSGDHTSRGLTYGGSLFRGSGFWSVRQNLPGPLTDHAAIGVDEQVYIIGGADANGTVVDQLWLYDATFHNYTAKAALLEPRYRFGAALLDNKIYVVGGRNNETDVAASLSLMTLIYDIATDTWSQGADLPEPQSDPCAAALYGKVYLVGGYDANYGYLSTVQIYDPQTNTWTSGKPMPTPRGDLMCADFNGELYVLGGYYDSGNSSDQDSFSSAMESYNPNTTLWTKQPDLLTPRGDGAITTLPGGKLLLIGGEGHYRNDQNLKYPKHTNEVFYATDGTWVEKAMIPTARFRTAAATAGGLAFVFGGADACLDRLICPALDTTALYLDTDHPHVYVYLKDDSYNDNAALTTYPV